MRVRDSSVTGTVSEVSNYAVTKGLFLVAEGFFLVTGMSGTSLFALTGGFDYVAYASLIGYDLRVRGVFLDSRPQAVNTQLEQFSIITVVGAPDMLE